MSQRFAIAALLGVLVGTGSAFAEPADIYLECLLDFERYAESIWHDAEAPARSGYFGDGASGGNGGIRGTCGIALAYAVLICEQPESPVRARRLRRLRATLNYAANTHQTGPDRCIDGKQWGFSWQSSLWTGSMALAAVLVEEDLPRELVIACQRVLAAEADRLSKIPPASGYRSDSKAEENAWNSNVPSIAAAWLADDPRSRTWLETARKYLVNTYTVPDRQGDPLAKWVTTTTLFPSFICENHGFFHPSYQMVSGMSLGDSLLMAELASPAIAPKKPFGNNLPHHVPLSQGGLQGVRKNAAGYFRTAPKLASFAEHNVQATWNCLSQVLLDSGELCYPSGLDWSLHGYGQVSYYAWLSTHFNDPLARWAESRLALLLRRRQEINGDGRFTGDGVPDGFYTEAVKARRVAIALLHHRHGRYANGPVTPPAPFVSHIPDAKLVLHRSKHGFFSVSYGPRVMALAVPAAATHPDTPYVVTPSVPSLLAHANQADLLDIVTSDNGFEVVLLLRFGAVSMEVVKVVSTGDALVVIASPAILPPADCFPVSIENHALTGGSRAVSVGEGSSVIQSMSGMQIRSTAGWLCVDGRLGYIAGPLGAIHYQAAAGYNRRGAAEDRIWFSPAQPRAARYALVIPDLTPEATQAIQSAVRWEDKENIASLRFEAPHSGQHTVALPMSKESALP